MSQARRSSTHILLCLALLGTACQGLADMLVDRSIVIFEPGDSTREDVKINNTGDDNLFIRVEVVAVERPGEPDEQRVEVTNPQEHKMIVTPSQLVVPPGGQKLIRLVNLQPSNNTERVYRVTVRPVVPPLAEGESQLRIVVAYQILAIIQPDSPSAVLKTSRDGSRITFTNSGNSNVLLSEGRQCAPDNTSDCRELAAHRLYAR